MTWQEFWTAIRNGLKGSLGMNSAISNASTNNDFFSSGGLLDQIKDGSYFTNGYVDEGGRFLAGIGEDGEGSLDAYSNLVSHGGKLTADQEKAFDNLMATEATNSARTWEEHMRDTDITSSASQLQSLGISPGTLSGATAGHSGVSAPSLDHTNIASFKAERSMNIARSVIGLAGSLASSGIHGASLYAVKKMAGEIASSSAKSAGDYVKKIEKPGKITKAEWDSLFKDDPEDEVKGEDWLPF